MQNFKVDFHKPQFTSACEEPNQLLSVRSLVCADIILKPGTSPAWAFGALVLYVAILFSISQSMSDLFQIRRLQIAIPKTYYVLRMWTIARSVT